MGFVLPLLFFVFALIFSVIVIILRIKLTAHINKLDVSENAPFIEVGSRRKFTNGYSRGLVKTQKPCKNGCTRFEFYPIDYEQGEYKKRPNLQRVIVKNEFIIRLARGDDSSYREIIKLIDRFRTDLPKKMRNTNEGEDMSKEGQKAFLESTFGSYITAGDEAIHEMMSQTSRVGMTKLTLAQLKEINQAMREGRIPNENLDGKKE